MSTSTQAKLSELGAMISPVVSLWELIVDQPEQRRLLLKPVAPKDRAALGPPGYVVSRIENLACQTTFDVHTRQGDVVLNLSTLETQRPGEALEIIRTVAGAGLGMGRYIKLDRGEADLGADGFLVGTVSSVTFDGVLRAHGIPVTARLGGLVELAQHELRRFTQIINYDATTVDPMEIFIKGGMTDVYRAAVTGSGVIGAGFRELPASALPTVRSLQKSLERIGIGGVLRLGEPGRPLLDIPVSPSRVGVIIAAGLNPIAAVEERGIPTRNAAVSLSFDFNSLDAVV